MRRKLFLLGGLFFLVSLVVFGVQISVAQAEEAPCFYIKDCPVPAPTIVVPKLNLSTYADELVIAGLSWNETLVDVYIDNIYNGRAELNLDNSGIANFAYKTFLPLTSGQHSVYTVARNLNARERSIESPAIEFLIIARPIVAQEEIVKGEVVTESDIETIFEEEVLEEGVEGEEGQFEDKTEETVAVSTEVDDPNISIAAEQEGEVNVSEGGQIGGGISEQTDVSISALQKTVDRDQILDEFFSGDTEVVVEQRSLRERQNRQIGLAMLGVIIVISIVWVIVSRDTLKVMKIKKKTIKEDEWVVDELVSEPVKTEDAMDDELDRLL